MLEYALYEPHLSNRLLPLVWYMYQLRIHVATHHGYIVSPYKPLHLASYHSDSQYLRPAYGREPEAPCKYPPSTKQSIQRTGFVLFNCLTLSTFIFIICLKIYDITNCLWTYAILVCQFFVSNYPSFIFFTNIICLLIG